MSMGLRLCCPQKIPSTFCNFFSLMLMVTRTLKRAGKMQIWTQQIISDAAFSPVLRSAFCAAWPHSGGSQGVSKARESRICQRYPILGSQRSADRWEHWGAPRREGHCRTSPEPFNFKCVSPAVWNNPDFPIFMFYFHFWKSSFFQLRGASWKIAFPEEWAKTPLFSMPKENSSTVITCAATSVISSFVSTYNYC